MELLHRNIADHLSYYISAEGETTAVMPDQEATFTLRFIQDFVGPDVGVACYTPEGYALVRNIKADVDALLVNDIATAILKETTGTNDVIRGQAFLIHPEHFDRRLVPAA